MVDYSTGYDDEQDRLDRADEQIREQRWSEFVAEIRPRLQSLGLNSILIHVCRASARVGMFSTLLTDQEMAPIEAAMISFAETEGWDGVLCAIARAYREEQKK